MISVILAIFLINLSLAFPVDEKNSREVVDEKLKDEEVETESPESVENVTQNEEENQGMLSLFL